MKHYEQERLTLKEFEGIVNIVETGLMQQIASHFDEKKWQILIKEFFYLKKLITEKETWLSGNETVFMKTMQKEYTRNRLEFILDQKIEELKDRILQFTESWTSMKPFVIWHIDNLSYYDSIENIAEGE